MLMVGWELEDAERRDWFGAVDSPGTKTGFKDGHD
jgi:hypothetical protein